MLVCVSVYLSASLLLQITFDIGTAFILGMCVPLGRHFHVVLRSNILGEVGGDSVFSNTSCVIFIIISVQDSFNCAEREC